MRAVVCGAGIAGLTLASRLAQVGWDVVVVEKASGLRDEGYMIDFFGSGYDVAERMGLLPRLRELAYGIRRVTWLDRSGRRVAGVRYDQFTRLLGGRLMSLMRGDLERALSEILPSSVTVRYGETVAAFRETNAGIRVELAGSTVEAADLLVGADGIHSHVRDLAMGRKAARLRGLGMQTAAFVLEDGGMNEHLGGEFKILSVPGRQVGFYPLRDGRVASFFVHRSGDRSLPTDPLAELDRVYRDLGWLVPAALDAAGRLPSIYYDTVAQVEMSTWHRGRTVLVGDACQAVSLVAGQGASLAMGGAYVLAEEIGRGDSVEAALGRYEARLKPVVAAKQAAGRRTAAWIAPATRWRLAARNAALRMADLPALEWILRPVFASGTDSVVRQKDK